MTRASVALAVVAARVWRPRVWRCRRTASANLLDNDMVPDARRGKTDDDGSRPSSGPRRPTITVRLGFGWNKRSVARRINVRVHYTFTSYEAHR